MAGPEPADVIGDSGRGIVAGLEAGVYFLLYLALGVWTWRRLWLAHQVVVFHSETDWVTGSSPPIAGQVYACKALAVELASRAPRLPA